MPYSPVIATLRSAMTITNRGRDAAAGDGREGDYDVKVLDDGSEVRLRRRVS